MPTEITKWLEAWYQQRTNGDWEHQHGISIETIDNPGWIVRVDLVGSNVDAKSFKRFESEVSEHDWLQCWIENNCFNIACGPENLSSGLEMFRDWIEEE